MSLFLSITLHNPDEAKLCEAGTTAWLKLSAGGEHAAIFTTPERAEAMAFAFNNPEAVLRMAKADEVPA